MGYFSQHIRNIKRKTTIQAERLDVENAVEFGQYEFLSACKTMGIVNDGLKNGLS